MLELNKVEHCLSSRASFSTYVKTCFVRNEDAKSLMNDSTIYGDCRVVGRRYSPYVHNGGGPLWYGMIALR